MVFYCEQAAGFCNSVGYQDESYFASLVTMFEQALKLATTLLDSNRDALFTRLDEVRGISDFAYGVGNDMDFLLAKYTRRKN